MDEEQPGLPSVHKGTGGEDVAPLSPINSQIQLTSEIPPEFPRAKSELITSRRICNAQTKAGQKCQNTAMQGSDLCINHFSQLNNAEKRNRYKSDQPVTLRELFEEHLNDDQPKDLIPEIAQIRTSISHLNEMLAIKIENAKANGKDIDSDDIKDYRMQLIALTESLRRLVESHARLYPESVVPLTEVQRMISRMMAIIRRHIDDKALREKIVGEIIQICMNEVGERSYQLTLGGPAKDPGGIPNNG